MGALQRRRDYLYSACSSFQDASTRKCHIDLLSKWHTLPVSRPALFQRLELTRKERAIRKKVERCVNRELDEFEG